MKTLKIYANPGSDSWDEIKASVTTANGLQSYFKCSLNELTTPLSVTSQRVDVNAYERQLSKARTPVSGLLFCAERFHGSLLVREILPRRIYVSCGVNKGLSAPPFRLYLLYQIAAAALTLGANLRPETNEAMIHRPAVGCLWDWWKGDGQRATAMMIARICQKCQLALRTHGALPPESIVAAQQILEYIRRSLMGESPAVANRVFVAYGHGDDWQSLKELLERWGLEVEYFNRQAVAGLMVAERWQQMLDRSRFAFAIMTPDDQLADGRRQARQNVVHEIGLCHARIGLRNTAILLAEGTEKFSNVDGVNYISFRSGHLEASAEMIRQLLEERGILDVVNASLAMAFEIPWLILLVVSGQAKYPAALLPQILHYVNQLGLEIDRPIESAIRLDDGGKTAMDLIATLGGSLAVHHPGLTAVYEAGVNLWPLAAKGKTREFEAAVAQLPLPEFLKTPREDRLAWLNQIHEYFAQHLHRAVPP